MVIEMIFGHNEEELKRMNAYNTSAEIVQQPAMWRRTCDLICENRESIADFLDERLDKSTRIIFTGAGTSDYIGDTIRSSVEECTGVQVEAIATTDIVVNPKEALDKERKTILVSFARSGNSPESVGAYQIMQDNIPDISHVVITCNKDGDLARKAKKASNGYVVLLPDETNDKGFAMTSSFSCMMLAALLFFDIGRLDRNKRYVEIISRQGTDILNNGWREVDKISARRPRRIVYLGTGCFDGLTQELALKNMELTNGEIPTMRESVLGFRHGPKTFMKADTDVIVLMSKNAYTNQYIKDLIRELYKDAGRSQLIVLAYWRDDEVEEICDGYIVIGGEDIPEIYMAFPYALYGQMLALFNSLRLGIGSDNPSPDGTVNRVVKGVILHHYTECGS